MKRESNIPQKLSMLSKDAHPEFASYCNLLSIGQRKRKDAMSHLNNFLADTNKWDCLSKSRFCKAVFSNIFPDDELSIILTTNLNEQLLKPTLIELAIAEPTNYLPFLWYGYYYQDTQFLKNAYKLNNDDVYIKRFLLQKLAKDLWISTHHLPDYYLGEFGNDLADIQLAFEIIESNKFETTEEINSYQNIFSEYKTLINSYLNDPSAS